MLKFRCRRATHASHVRRGTVANVEACAAQKIWLKKTPLPRWEESQAGHLGQSPPRRHRLRHQLCGPVRCPLRIRDPRRGKVLTGHRQASPRSRLQGCGLRERPDAGDDETSVPPRYPRIPAPEANYLKDPVQPVDGRTEEERPAAQARTRGRADRRRRADIRDNVKSLPEEKDMTARAP